ncbi:MAG TPA: hypothetical protein PLD62_07625 [Candidatus Cloacimonadota bacterium]|nr:hypothetical protein [Candidatus Cloacimonadota bacterium]
MKRNFKFFIIVLVGLFCLLSCSGKQTKTKFADIDFNIDQSLLSTKVVFDQIGISIQLPKGWESIEPEMLEVIKKNTFSAQDSEAVISIPVEVFMNKVNKASCFISSLQSTKSGDIRAEYLDRFKADHPDLDFNEGTFSHHGLDFYQLIFKQTDLIMIKLIIETNDNDFMIDYAVPAQYYEAELRSIESSIGSIQKTK